ncbi:MAG: hypothetical protein AB7O93_26690, partial [Vicinamibacterales bacterium]
MKRRGATWTLRVAAAAIGGAVGASAWLSMGALAVIDADRMTRVAALPPWTWLAALAAGGAAAGAWTLPRVERWAPLALLGLLWLPWLPVRVPAAFMPWDGVLEVPVWLAAIGGVAWPVVRDRLARAAGTWQDPRLAPWAVALLAAATYAGAWQTARPRVPAGDEPHYLVITQSLLNDGDFQIENNHRDGQYLAYFAGALRPDFMRRGTNRQIYSIHAPGVSALVLPAFAVAGYAGAVTTVIALVAPGPRASLAGRHPPDGLGRRRVGGDPRRRRLGAGRAARLHALPGRARGRHRHGRRGRPRGARLPEAAPALGMARERGRAGAAAVAPHPPRRRGR